MKSGKTQGFLDKAEECEIKALQAKDADARSSFSQLAQQWRELPMNRGSSWWPAREKRGAAERSGRRPLGLGLEGPVGSRPPIESFVCCMEPEVKASA